MSQQHELKTWPAYFEATWRGDKTFEIRYEDRGFQKGDTVILREWDRNWPCECDKTHGSECAKYSGREIEARIGYVLASTPSRGQQRGFSGGGYVVLSLCDMQQFKVEDVSAKPTPPKVLDAMAAIAGSDFGKPATEAGQ